MLDTRHHRRLVGKVGTLIALDHRAADGRTQERILAGALAHAAPAGLTADVDHRAEGPADAVGRGFDGRDASRVADTVHVPTHRHGERNGKCRRIAVYHVQAENHRDAQAALLNGDLLQGANALFPLDVEHATHLSGTYLFNDVAADRRAGDDVAADDRQIELPDFFLNRHLGHQVVDKAVHTGLIGSMERRDAQ